jgi:hypothetical protein
VAVVVTDSSCKEVFAERAARTRRTERAPLEDGRRMRTCLEPGRAPCTRGAHQQRAPASSLGSHLEQRQNDPSTASVLCASVYHSRYQHRAHARHPTSADSPEAARHQLVAASPLLAVAAAHCRRCIGRLELPSCDMHSPAPQSHVAPPAIPWHGLRFPSRCEPQQPKRAMFCTISRGAETSTGIVTHCTYLVILSRMP